MKTVIISPFSRALSTGENPKNFPNWKDVVDSLHRNNVEVWQVGVSGEKDIGADKQYVNKPLKELHQLVLSVNTWASVDNFFHHMCAYLKKPGVVVWGRSDPNIFGHSQNINLLKDRSVLRYSQFDIWEADKFDPAVFPNPDTVASAILSLL